MTQDQATALLAQVADLQQICMALGVVLGQVATWLGVIAILLLFVIAFQALRRS